MASWKKTSGHGQGIQDTNTDLWFFRNKNKSGKYKMTLKEKIKSDLKDAMKSGDSVVRGVLRLLSSDIKNEEIKQKKELSDDDVLKIIKKDIKRHKESIEQYKTGGRKDLVEQEEKELEILKEYMPEQMSEDEIRKIVSNVIKKKSIEEYLKNLGEEKREIKPEVMVTTLTGEFKNIGLLVVECRDDGIVEVLPGPGKPVVEIHESELWHYEDYRDAFVGAMIDEQILKRSADQN